MFSQWKQLSSGYTNADTFYKINLIEYACSEWRLTFKRRKDENIASKFKKKILIKSVFKQWISGIERRDTDEFHIMQKQKVKNLFILFSHSLVYINLETTNT